MTLRWSPHWALATATVADGDAVGEVIVSAGADRIVAVDGVSAAQVASVGEWARGAPVAVDHDRSLAPIRDRLAEIGAIAPVFPPAQAVDLIGSAAAQPLLDRLAALAPEPWRAIVGGRAAGIAVVVRTEQDWPTGPLDRVHLGLDLTMHHTALVGPLVLPGATTCIGCVQSRMARRWGLPAVAAAPMVHALLPVVAALLVVQLRLAVAGTSPLVNATVAWNFEQGTTDRQKTFKLSGCPTCVPPPTGDADGAEGRVRLPGTA